MVLPASLPLAATCAVTLHVALLKLTQCGGQPAQTDLNSARVMPHAHELTPFRSSPVLLLSETRICAKLRAFCIDMHGDHACKAC